MCTLALAWRLFADADVAVAANRDEVIDRPSEPPAVREWDRRVLAPMDREAGGTWIGVTDAGLFAGVTNRWVDVEGGGERSRGRLVRDALGTGSAADARDVVREAVERDTYEGFNLVLADADDAVLLWWDGDLHEVELEPGVHVVVNRGYDDEVEKARRVREALTGVATDVGAWHDRARDVLSDHEYEVCVHGETPDGRPFGTVSSSLVAIDADGGPAVDWQFAPGPPCETDYATIDVDFP